MMSLRARNLCGDYNLPRCTVITFGTVGWAKQQKTRTAIAEVDLHGSVSWRNYEVCNRALANRMVQKEDGTYFPSVSPARELIAENIATGRRWHAGFSRLLIDKDLRKQISYERKGLNAMVTQATWSEESERWFVEACHEAWRNRLGELGDRARREGADFTALVQRERERLRASFARCRSPQTVRKEVTDFWARGGRLRTVQQHWRDLLKLIEGGDWQRGRDLALLALVSYASPGEDESTNQGGEK
jgi:CRISPR-associated protein Cas8a1/Csx13